MSCLEQSKMQVDYYDYVIKTGKLELFQIQEEMIHEKINSNILPSQEMNDIALAMKL